ncbi:hypothetical protein P3S68_016567 [Capsicum galapagoense]
MEFSKEELLTVPIWIKLPGLDFKYWSMRGLSKIGSLVGKPLMVDRPTEKKLGFNFTRLLAEVKVGDELPDEIKFKNERGIVITQTVTYDWKPSICSHCCKYGHEKETCRKLLPKGQGKKAIMIVNDSDSEIEEGEIVVEPGKGKNSANTREGMRDTAQGGGNLISAGGEVTKENSWSHPKRPVIAIAGTQNVVRVGNNFKPLEQKQNGGSSKVGGLPLSLLGMVNILGMYEAINPL